MRAPPRSTVRHEGTRVVEPVPHLGVTRAEVAVGQDHLQRSKRRWPAGVGRKDERVQREQLLEVLRMHVDEGEGDTSHRCLRRLIEARSVDDLLDEAGGDRAVEVLVVGPEDDELGMVVGDG